MRAIHISSPPDLPATWFSTSAEKKLAVSLMRTHAERSSYFKKNRSWSILKTWLETKGNQKCWYCECKSSRAPFDIDHYRPKLRVTVDREGLDGYSGYYWLAYEWRNFRLSCQRCNRGEKADDGTLFGKVNEFPVRRETKRCNSRTDTLRREKPRLLDPCLSRDCDLLAHPTSGEVKPIAQDGSQKFWRARYTIDLIGLNKWNNPEEKKKSWQTLDLLIRLGGDTPEVVNQLKEFLSDEQEFSSFFRAAIGTHSEKDWVKSLL